LEGNGRVMKEVLSEYLLMETPFDINQKLKSLWECLEYENLVFENILIAKEGILWSISELSSSGDMIRISQDLSAAFHELIQCIQPLNVPLMISLIEDFDTTAQRIAGQDIILILGETGAGKSTSIHFLAGSEMEEIEINGFDHIQPTQISTNVRDLRVGASTQSVTKSIIAVQLVNGMIICDTPGFGETTGPEADIANGIGIIHSLALTKSVKLVMVLSQQNMDRLRGIRKMNQIMKAMFVDLQSILPCLTYFFTKYPAKSAPRICQQLIALRNEFTEEDHLDLGYVAIVEDLIGKTTPTAIVIDPLMSSSKSVPHTQVLDHLESLIPSTQSPEKIFKTFVSPYSADKLTAQWIILQRQVSGGLQNHNICFLSKLFNDMKILNKLQLEEYSSFYTDSIKLLENYAESQFTTGKEIFISSLFSRNNCDDNNLSRAFEFFSRLLMIHPLLCEHSDKYDFSSLVKKQIFDSLAQLATIEDYSDTSVAFRLLMLRQVSHTTEHFFYFSVQNGLQPHPVFQYSDIPITFLEKVCSYYLESISHLNFYLLSLIAEIKSLIDSFSEPSRLVLSLRKVVDVVLILSNHLPNAGIENFEAQLSSYFFHRLESQINLFSAHFYPEIDGEFGASVSDGPIFIQSQLFEVLSKLSPSVIDQSSRR
jgi:GTP-binding protein EngB required for normal cell division